MALASLLTCLRFYPPSAFQATGSYRFYLPLITDFWGRILVRRFHLMAKQRTHPLTHEEQKGFVQYHLPGRFQAIEFHLNRSPRVYGDLAAAAIFARALCGFLGLRVDRDGKLAQDRTYFEHAGKQSWEVKITDLAGGQFLRAEHLPAHDRTALEKGLQESNVAFAHLTFWT